VAKNEYNQSVCGQNG